MSMRWRLIASYVFVVLIAVLAVVVFVRLDTAQQVETYFFGGGMVGAETAVTTLETYYAQNGSWAGVENIVTSLHTSAGSGGRGQGQGRRQGAGPLSQLQLMDQNGVVLYDSIDGSMINSKLATEQMATAIKLKDKKGNLIGYLIANGGGVGLQTGDEKPLLQSLNNAAIQAGLVGILIATLVALIFAAGLLRPISHLILAADKLSQGDLTQKVRVKGKDELSTLAAAFNNMSESLFQSEQRRKAMTADISHELRTPLAVQRAHLEALQDGIYPLTVENLQPIFEQTRLLSRLVDDLRIIALADAGELRLNLSRVEIINIIKVLLDNFQSAATAQDICLEFIHPGLEKVYLSGDADRLSQILNNLLSNALRFTPRGGRIWVIASRSADAFSVSIRDSGPGIAQEALPNVFERFYRADRSRSREDGGTGLGLAIARQLALAHNGILTAGNHPEGGAVFSLTLPLLD